MKAAIYYDVGDVRIEEIEKPKAGPGEVVIKVEAALTCGTDVKTYKRGHPLRKPGASGFGHESSELLSKQEKVLSLKLTTALLLTILLLAMRVISAKWGSPACAVIER